jgi:HK97 family phage major capsid protein
MTDEAKATSKQDELTQVYVAFDKLLYPGMEEYKPMPGVVEIFEDHVIACMDGTHYKIGYRQGENGVEFDEREKWEEVEEEWVAKKSITDEVIYPGDEIKAAKMDNGAVKLGGYLVRFGDADNTDLSGDYFTKDTDFGDAKESTVWFNHRMPVSIKKHNIEVKYTEPLSGKATLKIDDVGVFAEVVIEARNEYEKTIAELGLAGKLAYSSGTAGHLVDRKSIRDGVWEITRWMLGLDASFTPTPAEPRKSNQIVPIKSLFPAESAALTDAADKQTQPIKQPIDQREKNIMEEKVIKSAVAQAVADALAEREAKSQAEAQKAAELKAAEEKGYKAAVEELKANPSKTFYHTTEPTDDDNDGIGAFKSWLHTGQVNDGLIRPDSSFDRIPAGKAAWNVTTGASGGFLVPDPLYNQIIAKRNIMSWVRQVSCTFLETPSDHLLVPREDTSVTDFVLTAEANSYNQNEGTVSQKDLILYKYTKRTQVSEEFLMYNGTNWESWFANALGRAVAGTENTIFTTGTGTSQPEGIVTGATVANTTATTDIILPSELAALIGYLGGGYNVASECAMLMANTTKWYLKGSGGTSVVPFAYVATPQDGDFFGYKAIVNDDLEPYTTASAKCVLFGNFNYFAVVEKPGMIVQRNPYLSMATGQIDIFASIFRGSGVLQSEAFYYLTNKAS